MTPVFTEGPRLRWDVNQAFLDLEPEEIRFALVYQTLPRPTSIEKFFWPGLFLVLIGYFVLDWLNPSMNKITLLILWPGALANPYAYMATETAHLDQVIAITKDPISARTYLTKVHGDRHLSFWQKLDPRKIHPIRAYMRYGKDERVKAILGSDLVHPSIGGSAK